MSISASQARQELFPLIAEVLNDHTVKRISSRAGEVVLMSADDYDAWAETVYLLRSPANAARLMAAVERDKAGQVSVTTTIDELDDLAGEQT